MKWSQFEGVILGSSAKAVFFQSHYWDEGTWLPLSQVTIEPDGDFFHVVKVKGWLVEKKELEEFCHFGAEHMEKLNAEV